MGRIGRSEREYFGNRQRGPLWTLISPQYSSQDRYFGDAEAPFDPNACRSIDITPVTATAPRPLRRADYGLDAPRAVRGMFLTAAICLIAASSLRLGTPPGYRYAGVSLTWTGGYYLFFGSLMYLSSRIGKLRARDALLDRLQLDPSAVVLDAGCGHGLLLIGAAHRVPSGRAVGIDIWSQRDQGDNCAAATLANATAEGVADRVEVREGDIRELPFADASFDAIVSNLVIHNISGRDQRRRAINEFVRVLKPGGQIGIMDLGHVGQYAADLRAAGMSQVRAHGITPWIFPPTRVLTALK
jgi:arsenite methyltransferase